MSEQPEPIDVLLDRILKRTRYEILATVLAVETPTPEPEPKTEGMMGIKRACEYLQCSETQLRQMVKEGLLPERRVGNRLRFKSQELDKATEVKTRLQKVG